MPNGREGSVQQWLERTLRAYGVTYTRPVQRTIRLSSKPAECGSRRKQCWRHRKGRPAVAALLSWNLRAHGIRYTQTARRKTRQSSEPNESNSRCKRLQKLEYGRPGVVPEGIQDGKLLDARRSSSPHRGTPPTVPYMTLCASAAYLQALAFSNPLAFCVASLLRFFTILDSGDFSITCARAGKDYTLF
jgi:hypothetical protein